jgi:hypothetical protein
LLQPEHDDLLPERDSEFYRAKYPLNGVLVAAGGEILRVCAWITRQPSVFTDAAGIEDRERKQNTAESGKWFGN